MRTGFITKISASFQGLIPTEMKRSDSRGHYEGGSRAALDPHSQA